MKGKLTGLFLSICMLLSLTLPVSAFTEYGNAYDVTDLLDSTYMSTFGQEYLPALSSELGLDIRVDVVDDLEGNTIEAYAQIFYTNYGYGEAFGGRGILLMLEVGYEDDGLYFWDYCVYSPDGALASYVDEGLEEALYEGVFDGDLEDDRSACEYALELYARLISEYGPAVPESPAPEAAPAQLPSGYVSDGAGLLTPDEAAQLEEQAARISRQYQCGLYIVTVEDFRSSGIQTIDTFSSTLYESTGMGMGSGKDGLLLVLSMEDRDYNLRAEGAYGQAAFTSYGLDALESALLDDLGENDWAGAFRTYLDKGETYLSMAAEGTPFDADSDPTAIMIKAAIVVLAPCLVALAVCTVFRMQMKSVHKQTSAKAYMVMDEARLRVREDRFIRTTETRRKIEKKRSSGSSGGGSSRSGKF